MPLTIRPEGLEDFACIHDLVRLAFVDAPYADGDEHFLVDRLRCSAEYIPQLSLVAEEEGNIVGHVMFSKVTVGEAAALSLAPLSVLPGHQGRGLGSALVRHGHESARSMGWDFVVLLGHAGYYPRCGHKLAASLGILAPFDAPEEAFMAISLKSRSGSLPGMVRYSPVFSLEKAD